ncbi:hypothetical protein FB451DRAFT_1263562 [Mycena latifolia]|nr:hypothetical protein FB451DRAFT_1263562 [Mycena latifolia]
MRHFLLAFIVKLLLTLLSQVTLSAAAPRHNGFPGGFPHPSFSFVFPFGSPTSTLALSTTTTSTSSVVSTPTTQSVTPPDTTKPASSFQNAAQVSSHVSSTLLSSPASKSAPVSAARSSSRSPASTGPSSTGAADSLPDTTPSNVASNSPETSGTPIPVSSSRTDKALLAEIIVPVIFAALVAGAFIVAVYRHRNSQDNKSWEGSRLPELETRNSLWSFVRPRNVVKDAQPRNDRDASTYLGTGDWNRSDTYLRSAVAEKDRHSITESATEHGSSQDHAGESPHSDTGHVNDFARVFHSESPLHGQDEPALAESRPATLIAPVPVALPRDGPGDPETS